MYQGISVLQPPHQVAQKSSRTTFPLYADNLMGAPLASAREKSGAGLPMDGAEDLCVQPTKSKHSATNTNAVNARYGIENPQQTCFDCSLIQRGYKASACLGSIPDEAQFSMRLLGWRNIPIAGCSRSRRCCETWAVVLSEVCLPRAGIRSRRIPAFSPGARDNGASRSQEGSSGVGWNADGRHRPCGRALMPVSASPRRGNRVQPGA